MWALQWNQRCYPASPSKRVKQNRNVECGHFQGIKLVDSDVLSKRAKRINNRNVERWHSPGIKFVTWHLSQSVQNAIGAVHVGTPRESNLFSGILSKLVLVKHNRNAECGHSQGIKVVAWRPLKAYVTRQKHQIWALPGNQLCYPASLSKGVKQSGNAEGGHSQGINESILLLGISLKACKTQQKCGVWALPGNHCGYPASSQSV